MRTKKSSLSETAKQQQEQWRMAMPEEKRWQDWLEERRRDFSISAEKVNMLAGLGSHWMKDIPQRALKEWLIEASEGILRRHDRKFFHILMMEVCVKLRGDVVSKWVQPFIRTDDPVHEICVMAVADSKAGKAGLFFLLRADKEPGRLTLGLRPTLQEWISKLDENPDFPRADLRNHLTRNAMAPHDPKIFFEKSHNIGYAKFPDTEAFHAKHGAILPEERWFSLGEMAEVIDAQEASDHLLLPLSLILLDKRTR